MLNINPHTYRSIIFAIATVTIINILQPSSFLHSLIIAIVLGIFFGICITLLNTKLK